MALIRVSYYIVVSLLVVNCQIINCNQVPVINLYAVCWYVVEVS